MRRAALFVCLSLVLVSVLPLAAPVAAQQQLPVAFVGGWQGTMVVRSPDTEYSFGFSLTLTGGSTGAIVGTVYYPAGPDRTWPCGGDLELGRVATDGSWVELVEKLTVGQSYCTLYDAIITLTLQGDGSLAYQWSHPDFGGTATATLTLSGATTASTVISIPPTPSPTSVPPSTQAVPTAPVRASGTIVLADDFRDPASSVLAAASSDLFQRVAFDAGEFVLERLVTTASGFNTLGVPGPYADATIAVSARLPSASAKQYVGLGCRGQGSVSALSNVYALVVFPAVQTVGLIRVDNGQSTVISPLATSPAINSIGTASNRLELSCIGDTIAARINGVEVASVRDATYQSGGAVLLVGNDAAGTAEARFDNFEVTAFSALSQVLAPTAIPAPRIVLPPAFVGRWEGTMSWNDAALPVVLELTGGSRGEVVGSVEYALYGSAGPRCGGDVTLESVAADGREIALEGIITFDPAVCLIDAVVGISLQDTGAVGYLWNHPALTVSGTGTLIHTSPTN